MIFIYESRMVIMDFNLPAAAILLIQHVTANNLWQPNMSVADKATTIRLIYRRLSNGHKTHALGSVWPLMYRRQIQIPRIWISGAES